MKGIAWAFSPQRIGWGAYLGLRPRLNIGRAVGPCQTTAKQQRQIRSICRYGLRQFHCWDIYSTQPATPGSVFPWEIILGDFGTGAAVCDRRGLPPYLFSLRRLGLKGSKWPQARVDTGLFKLSKIGTVVRIGVRRILLQFSSTCPWKDIRPGAPQTITRQRSPIMQTPGKWLATDSNAPPNDCPRDMRPTSCQSA